MNINEDENAIGRILQSDKAHDTAGLPSVYEAMQLLADLPEDARAMLTLHDEAMTDPLVMQFLMRARASWKIISSDMDHTVYDRGIKLDDEKRLNIEAYSAIERQNLDLLIIHALMGNPVVIETGKDANIWPMATYMTKRLDRLAEILGMTDDARTNNTSPDARLRSFDGAKPVLLAFSIGNGGLTLDLTARDGKDGIIVYKPIPLESWEKIQEDEELLRMSTADSRVRQLTGKEPNGSQPEGENLKDLRIIPLGDDEPKRTYRMPPRIPYVESEDPYTRPGFHNRTNQLHRVDLTHIGASEEFKREVAPQLSDEELEHRMKLQASMRDILAFTPWSTKANIVFDLSRIVSNPSINKLWFKRTGIRIAGETEVEQRDALYKACEVLAVSWGNVTVAQAYANGTFYLDITAPNVNKLANSRWVKKIAQALTAMEMSQETGVEFSAELVSNFLGNNKLVSLRIGDGGRRSNDDPLIYAAGGASVSVDDEPNKTKEKDVDEKKNTLFLSRVFGNYSNISLTNKFLLFHLLSGQYADESVGVKLREKLLDIARSEWKSIE